MCLPVTLAILQQQLVSDAGQHFQPSKMLSPVIMDANLTCRFFKKSADVDYKNLWQRALEASSIVLCAVNDEKYNHIADEVILWTTP